MEANFWRERVGMREITYSYDGKNIIATERKEGNITGLIIEPFITLPLNMGIEFIKLFCDEVENKSLNTRKIDMQSGKIELLESELSFNKDQLVKFINHFTK